MTMYLDRIGAVSAPSRRSWTARACSLYALAVGADWGDLAFVTEGVEGLPQRVYPTFVLAGVLAAESESWPDPGFATGDYQPHELVLAGQSLVLHRPVTPNGAVVVRTRVGGIVDKRSGALVHLDVEAVSAYTGEAAFDARVSLFAIGHGGFGGSPGPPEPDATIPCRAPDLEVAVPTMPVQSLLYSHAGNDRNAIHRDPAVAARAGFRAPILMGQNTLGFACRAIVNEIARGRPERLRSIEGRFAAPGYNGDVLTTQCWVGWGVGADEHGRLLVRFRVVNQDGAVLIDRGRATLS